MHRFRARRSKRSALAVLGVLFALAAAPRAACADPSSFWFDGAPLRFDHPIALEDDVAVTTRDAGLQRFLKRLGATLSANPSQRYVTVTAADRRVVAFTLGDRRFAIAGVQQEAPFAPFADGGDTVIPFLALARALYVQPVTIGDELVLQPVLGALDVRPDGARTVVTIRGALPLRVQRGAETADRVTLAFAGEGTTLAPSRRSVGAGIDQIDVAATGTPRAPSAALTISGVRGATHRVLPQTLPNELSVVFAPAGVALDGAVTAAAGAPAATPAPDDGVVVPPPSGGTSVTGVAIDPMPDGLNVRIAVNGQTTYTWHRLADDRWYVDVANATLSGAGRDERPSSRVVTSVRVRQIGTPDTPVVRVALTMTGDRRVEISGFDGGLLVAVGDAANTLAARTGSGRIGPSDLAQSAAAVASPGPGLAPLPDATPWKFGGAAPAAPPAAPAANANSRLIVIDPGHGGGDTGATHNGLVEKTLTFDISQRLRTMLVAQGWTVRMTRESDVDPHDDALIAAYRGDGLPNPDDRAYLQTRANVANNAGARMFISVHINSSTSSGPAGTTTYYYKPQDLQLANAVHAALRSLGTVDDGTRREKFYVLNHTTMPAILVETAFVSNPSDAALLADPGFRQHVAEAIAAGVKSYTGGASGQPVSVQGGL